MRDNAETSSFSKFSCNDDRDVDVDGDIIALTTKSSLVFMGIDLSSF
jgi:hypothetical protein